MSRGLEKLHGPLILGVYRTLGWVISVMLPPMAIFFPLFTLLEDLGYLPRVAFNLDNFFKKACAHGKQALTMCMGFGCNAAGVIGCRIIDSPRERLIAIITNTFVPCNGRFPILISITMIFIASNFSGSFNGVIAALTVTLIIILGIIATLLSSKLLSKTLLKGEPSSFTLELPPYRKPKVGQILIRSILDRTLFVLGRAIVVAAPAGLILWFFANTYVGDNSILQICANFLNPFAKAIGMDGYILLAFILGLPANEIVIPIIIMSYMSAGALIEFQNLSTLRDLLIANGWTIVTAINVMIFTLMHFPCGTTLLTIRKETGSFKWTLVSFLLPTLFGIVVCFLVTQTFALFPIC
ncbi:ferrous iron transport protein B [Clostridium cochlearium]|nr:ferrous iron transport protein B [Clostridium cochlearium]